MQARVKLTPRIIARLIVGKPVTVNLPAGTTSLALSTDGNFYEFLRAFHSTWEFTGEETQPRERVIGLFDLIFGSH